MSLGVIPDIVIYPHKAVNDSKVIYEALDCQDTENVINRKISCKSLWVQTRQHFDEQPRYVSLRFHSRAS